MPLYVKNLTSTPITANAIGAARFELSAQGQRGDNKVLPLSVANLPGFQRIWAATPARITVATDAAFVNVVTSIPAEGGGPTAADDIVGASTVGKNVIKAADAAAARTAIGAGTSSVVVGTGATNAKAGNYAPTWAEVTAKPVVIASGADAAAARTAIGAGTSNLVVGTAVTDAKAGNYTPPNASTSVKGLVNQAATQAAMAATPADLTAVATSYNALLAALKTAGIVA